ncbi:MAG: EAL domain-containing protein [Clostridiales bacterium]|nr:EAL domain-containing protein [Clostridiales bacterium]
MGGYFSFLLSVFICASVMASNVYFYTAIDYRFRGMARKARYLISAGAFLALMIINEKIVPYMLMGIEYGNFNIAAYLAYIFAGAYSAILACAAFGAYLFFTNVSNTGNIYSIIIQMTITLLTAYAVDIFLSRKHKKPDEIMLLLSGIILTLEKFLYAMLIDEPVADYDRYIIFNLIFILLPGEILIKRNKVYKAVKKFKFSKRLFEIIFNSAPVMIFYKNKENMLTKVNSNCAEEIGIPAQKLVGMPLEGIFPSDDVQMYKREDSIVMETGKSMKNIVRSIRTKNGVRWLKTDKVPYIDEDGVASGVIGFSVDITERRDLGDKVNYMAYYDLVTGLPNRALFKDRLSVAITHARRNKLKIAVMFLDVDNFKSINDTKGHAVGDKFLCNIAKTLESCLREEDTIARFGGDEFVMLIHNIKDPSDVQNVAARINSRCRQPWILDDGKFYATISIGVAIFPKDGEDTETLLKNADAAMYRAKEAGKDNCEFYTKSINTDLIKKLELEEYLRHAMESNQFLLYYQPQININTMRVIGLEALLRWEHPRLGMLAPGEFIPLAEETGFIVPIGVWIVQAVCRQIRKWEDEGIPDLTVAVNISARQFQQSGLMEIILDSIKRESISTKLLELEITESTAIQNIEYTQKILKYLNDAGLHITLDDFGTGYSSLNYLRQLPFNALKMDKSFVGGIKYKSRENGIAEAIISLAHNLNLDVTAEGVETKEQLYLLKSFGCDNVQGYIFSKPLTSYETANFVRNWQNKYKQGAAYNI